MHTRVIADILQQSDRTRNGRRAGPSYTEGQRPSCSHPKCHGTKHRYAHTVLHALFTCTHTILNADEIMARTDRVDILVDRAENLNTHTFEFRRQAQQFQRMMWWREKKLVFGIAAAIFAALTLFSSLQFGFPISL